MVKVGGNELGHVFIAQGNRSRIPSIDLKSGHVSLFRQAEIRMNRGSRNGSALTRATPKSRPFRFGTREKIGEALHGEWCLALNFKSVVTGEGLEGPLLSPDSRCSQ
jgi:hypothetical protein